MRRYEMVKSHEDFNKIINTGKKKSSKSIVMFSLKKDYPKPNFGIAVGKKIGNAVVRNKYKRRFRNIIDNNKLLFSNYNNYIIMIKKEALKSSYEELENELVRLLNEK